MTSPNAARMPARSDVSVADLLVDGLASIQKIHQRHAMAHTVVGLLEGFRNDYFPFLDTLEAVELLFILAKMLDLHAFKKDATPSAIARSTRIPRTSVNRRLAYLKSIGAVMKTGPSRYQITASYMNSPVMLRGFGVRRNVVKRLGKKLDD